MAYTPRKHGNVAVNEELPYYERWLHYEYGTGLANNSGWNTLAMGTFVLPWPGQVIADMTLDISWQGYQQVGGRLAVSSPAPIQETEIPRIGANQYSDQISTIPVYARWELPTVQTVTMTLQVFVGGGGGSATVYRIAGSIRGMAS